jgi:hypothetical protein
LFDLASDPGELHNLGAAPRFAGERDRLRGVLFE